MEETGRRPWTACGTAELLRSEVVRSRRGAHCGRIEAAGITVVDILCCEDRTSFVGPGQQEEHCVVLTRSGGYLRRVAGEEFFVDATGGYLTAPGDEHHVAHPVGPGDRSTDIRIGPQLYADRFDCPRTSRRLTVSGAADLRHRALLAAARRGAETFELAERIHLLLDELAATAGRWSPDSPARRSTVRVHQRLVRDTCAVLAGGIPALLLPLEDLARAVGVSPHHLSRVFHAVTGTTLTRYRNELRVRGVLQQLEEGHDGLRTLAAAYGFADQAHLTRTCRTHTGHLPSAVRRLLADRA
ncbi:helix-turn-helix transcriptional regulator [Streptomyces sp. NPDC048629]|uniref:helix-turn-helix domain-containing protein n=1 Tax=Streptomyces sp. NPDC048629 TaxID=3154824 RepID=UPI00341B877E